MKTEKPTTIYIRDVPRDIARQAKSIAAAEGRTLRDVVIRALEEYGSKFDRRPPK